MHVIPSIDISNITVQIWAAHRHHWVEGQKFHHDPLAVENSRQDFQLWLVQQGCVQFIAGDKVWQIKEGEACFIPASLERVVFTSQESSWLSLRLWITIFNKFHLMSNVSLPAQWHPEESERYKMELWMDQVADEFHMEEAHHRLIANGLVHALFGLCWPHLSSESLTASSHSELPPWLTQTLQRITTDPSWTITDLAHEAGFSPAQFRRAFHHHIGTTPRTYLTSRRLEAARHFLEHTDLTLRVIAQRVGLNDIDHFSQIFKSAYGLSPSQYRASRYEEEK